MIYGIGYGVLKCEIHRPLNCKLGLGEDDVAGIACMKCRRNYESLGESNERNPHQEDTAMNSQSKHLLR